jgi:hypothetical protein
MTRSATSPTAHRPRHDVTRLDVISHVETLGTVEAESRGAQVFQVGRKPLGKYLTSAEFPELWRFISKVGRVPDVASQARTHRDPSAPGLPAAIDHHEVRDARGASAPAERGWLLAIGDLFWVGGEGAAR